MIRFAIAVFLILLLPRLWTFGVFLDGLLYASIARNMAQGAGSFNAPYYSDFIGQVFNWHPPLSMWLHSLFYRALGDHSLVDTLYGLTCGAIINYLLYLIYRTIDPPEKGDSPKPYWSVILIFSLMPMTSWIFSNNMLEITMTMFVLASVFFQLRALNFKTNLLLINYFLAGGFLSLAVLSKNIAGLFPLILPMFHYFLFRKISFAKTLFLGVFLMTVTLVCGYAILFFSNALDFYKGYIQAQLVPSISGVLPGEDRGFLQNLWLIISEMLVPAFLAVILHFVFKKRDEIRINRIALFFLLLGLSGTIPLFLVQKFRSYYIFPGLPFYALFVSIIFSDIFSRVENLFISSLRFRRFINYLSGILAAGAVVLFFAGKNYPARLKDFKFDVFDTFKKIEDRGTIYACSGEVDYTLIAAFQKYYKMSLLYSSNPENPGWLLETKKSPCSIARTCKKINRENSIIYNVYACSKK